MQVAASTIIGRSISGKLPFSSSMLPADPTPTSVPKVSRKPMRNRVRRIGSILNFSIPMMSILKAIALRLYSPTKGRDMAARGASPYPVKYPRTAVAAMPSIIPPRTRKYISVLIKKKPNSARMTCAERRSPSFKGTAGAESTKALPWMSTSGLIPTTELVTIPVS